MKKSFTDKQRRLYGAVAVTLLAIFILLLMAERWTVFVPYGGTLLALNWFYGIYLFGFLLLCYIRIKGGFRTTLRNYISAFGGVLLGSWGFGQATYGLLLTTNRFSLKDESLLCLNVMDNSDAPEGLFSTTHTIDVALQGDPDRIVRPIRYRYPEIAFRGLRAGNAVQVLARPGWAGYTLEKVVTGAGACDMSLQSGERGHAHLVVIRPRLPQMQLHIADARQHAQAT